jgi:hypothetical protein
VTLLHSCRFAHLNPLNAELNPICHLLALLGAHHILHVSRIRVKSKTSYFGAIAITARWRSCIVKRACVLVVKILHFIAGLAIARWLSCTWYRTVYRKVTHCDRSVLHWETRLRITWWRNCTLQRDLTARWQFKIVSKYVFPCDILCNTLHERYCTVTFSYCCRASFSATTNPRALSAVTSLSCCRKWPGRVQATTCALPPIPRVRRSAMNSPSGLNVSN